MKNNTCAICGAIHNELYELGGQCICEACAKAQGYVRCFDCDEWVHEDYAIETELGHLICESCYESDYITCEDCGAVIPSCDANRAIVDRWGTEGYVCEGCLDNDYTFCDHCETYVRNSRIWASDRNLTICDDCADYYRICEDCDTIIHEDDGYYDEDSCEWLCRHCYEERNGGGRIHNYTFKPEPDFKLRSSEIKNTENPLVSIHTIGAELEVDCGSDPAELAKELTELGMPMYLKHDGSLSSVGVEIVTHPCSLDFHRYDMRWSEISRLCRKHGYTSHKAGTCGLHLHVGRMQMGNTPEARYATAGNLVLLTYKLWDNLVTFSRRREDQLDSWANKPFLPELELDAHLTEQELTDMAMRTRNRGRYQAINLCNMNTVEFRIFRGTLKRDTIIASMELVINMTKYAMNHTPTECLNATWQDVVGVEEFKELKAYCEARGL